MEQYPVGTRLLFAAHHATGIGVHQIYAFAPCRWLVTLLDNLFGKPPT